MFPGDDEESKIDLSDGKKYLTGWVLLSEQKEGGWHGATEEGKNEACGRVVVVVWGKAPLPARPSPSRLQAQGKEEKAVGGGVVLVRVFCDGSCLCGMFKKNAHQHQRTRSRKPLVIF